MASSTRTKRVDIPNRLWEALDKVAAKEGASTSQLIGTWLYEELHRRSRIAGNTAEGLALDDNPYRLIVRAYPRRQRAEG